jgi:acyl-CoA reductase-like NAD-dependent aldehyde dehydrogenase
MSGKPMASSGSTYPRPMPYVGTDWFSDSSHPGREVINPTTGQVLAALPCVGHEPLALALETAATSFATWRESLALERSRILRSAMAAAAAALRVGDGVDPAVQMGPLANARRVAAPQSLVDDAVAQGAVLLTGGRALPGAGFFFEPTVLADVPPDARIMHEEPFGPVVAVAAVPGGREAIERANGVPFGLAGYVFSEDVALAQWAARALEVGMVAVNHVQVALPETPFGGVKHSGFGSEGGVEGLAAYLTPKALSEWQAEGWR